MRLLLRQEVAGRIRGEDEGGRGKRGVEGSAVSVATGVTTGVVLRGRRREGSPCLLSLSSYSGERRQMVLFYFLSLFLLGGKTSNGFVLLFGCCCLDADYTL